MEFKLSQITKKDVTQAFDAYFPYQVQVKAVSFFPEDQHKALTRYDGVLLVDIITSDKNIETFCFDTRGLINVLSSSYILLKEADDFKAFDMFSDSLFFTRAFYRMMTEKFGIDFFSYAKQYQLETMKNARHNFEIKKYRTEIQLSTLKRKIKQKSAELKQKYLDGEDITQELKSLREKTDAYLEFRHHPEQVWSDEEKKYKYHRNLSLWLTDTKKQMLKLYNQKNQTTKFV